MTAGGWTGEWDRRTLLFAGGAAAGSLLLPGCGAKPSAAGVLRASITGKGEGDTRLLLNTAGIAPDGFRVDYSNFQSGHLVVEAFNAGSLDYGGASEIPPVFAAASTMQSFARSRSRMATSTTRSYWCRAGRRSKASPT